MGRGLALKRPAIWLFVTAAVVLMLDQASKAAVRDLVQPGESLPLIPGVLWLTHVANRGAAFSLLTGLRPLFLLTTFVVLAGIWWVWRHYRPTNPLVVIALGLIAGGALGNFLDRLLAGQVTDFLDVRWWPVFNVADSSLVVGVIIIVVWLLFHHEEDDEPAEAGKA